MRAVLFRFLILLTISLAASNDLALLAQVDQGRIVGSVVDPSGAPISNAIVTVKNERTGDDRMGATDSNGLYVIAALRPSLYTIRVSFAGFATAEVSGVQLNVGQEIHRNFSMQLAQLASTLTVVEAVEPAIDTSSARMGVNVNQREVHDLPLNGRQLAQLYLQAPGSLNSGSGTFGDIRFSGRAVQQNAIRFDGIEGSAIIDSSPGNLNGEVPSPFRLQSSLENVQEFRVDSNGFPAEYGTGTGGQISVVTRSGSNAFHGSVFEYLRNDLLDARNAFDPLTSKSKLRLNQFGASLGGPIKKQKLFFFAYYEGYRLRQSINFREAVPSQAVQNLPACATGQTPGPGPVYTCVNPAIKPLLPGFIGPGAIVLPGVSGDPNFDIARLASSINVNEDSGGLRLDYQVSTKHRLYARYFRDQGENSQPEGVTGRRSLITAWPQNGVLSLLSNVTNNLVNEAKFGYNEARTTVNGLAPTTNGVDFSALIINISGSVANTGIAGQGGSSGIAIPGGLVRSNSATNGRGQPYTPYSLSFIDNVSWMTGRHNVKFGTEIRLLRLYTDRLGGTTYTFQNLSNFLANNLQQVQFLGDLSAPSVFNNGFTGNRQGQQEYYIGYLQDEMRLRSNLTLNVGLRYEYYTPMREAHDNGVLFDINNGTLRPKGTDFYDADTYGFGPRVSVAWSPFASRNGLFGHDRTVLRAGFGLYNGPGQTEDLIQPIESDRVSSTISGGTYPIDPAVITSNFVNNPNNRSFQPRAYAAGYTVPERIYQYSTSWQQQWGHQTVSTIAYVGSQGRNLFLRSVANRIIAVRNNSSASCTPAVLPPATCSAIVARQFDIDNGGNSVLRPFAEVDYKTSGGHDSYNALQASLVRRSNSGLTLAAQYTYGRSYGNTAGSNEALTAGDPFDFDYDNGYNMFDVRNTFNLSALYELPFGRGKSYLSQMNAIGQALFGGWTLGSIVNTRSGLPLDIRIVRPDVVYVDAAGNVFSSMATGRTAVINTLGGGASRNVRRPDLVLGVDPYLQDGTFWLNPAAFATPQPGSFGNLQRGKLRGPGFTQVDMTVMKRFPIRETVGLEFRAEFFNLLNHTNFANPPVTLANALGTGTNQVQPGQPFTQAAAGSSFSRLSATTERTVGLGTNRQIQFSLRLNF